MQSWKSKLEITHVKKRKQMLSRHRNYQFASVLKYPVHFSQKLSLLVNVLKYVQNSDRVERSIIERQVSRLLYLLMIIFLLKKRRLKRLWIT